MKKWDEWERYFGVQCGVSLATVMKYLKFMSFLLDLFANLAKKSSVKQKQ
jgi:hypothetical protein